MDSLYDFQGYYSILKHTVNIYAFSLKNTDSNEAITINDVKSIVFVTREGNFTRTGLEDVDEAEVFQGADNMITMIQTHSKKFHCTYLLHDFPFDTQVS